MSEGTKKFFKEWVIPFGIEVIVLLLIYNFWFFFVTVPTGSMVPTIAEKSFLVSFRVYNPLETVERGDIIVFHSDEFDQKFVKRTIGLPGEQVTIDENGVVYIDGVELDEPYVRNISRSAGEYTVPEGHYFFLGDNRAESNDARYWSQPYIPAEKLEGNTKFTLWPLENFGILE